MVLLHGYLATAQSRWMAPGCSCSIIVGMGTAADIRRQLSTPRTSWPTMRWRSLANWSGAECRWGEAQGLCVDDVWNGQVVIQRTIVQVDKALAGNGTRFATKEYPKNRKPRRLSVIAALVTGNDDHPRIASANPEHVRHVELSAAAIDTTIGPPNGCAGHTKSPTAYASTTPRRRIKLALHRSPRGAWSMQRGSPDCGVMIVS